LVEHGVPWASTYGNHDSQFNLSREALFQEENKYSLSYGSLTLKEERRFKALKNQSQIG
jgi:hypothetical protein